MLNKRIIHLAIPMILSNLTVPLLGIVNTAVMGHLPHAYYLAAVGIGAMLFDLLYWSFGFLRMGTTGLAAQAYGRQDISQMTLVLARNALIGLVLGLLLLLLQIPIAWVAFHLVDASAVVTHYAKLYFHYRIWGAPAVMLNIVLLGWFIGIQKPRIPLLLMLVINVTAAVLDVWFVFGLHMTTDGVGLATVIAQYIGLAVGCYAVYSVLRGRAWHWSSGVLLAKDKLLELFQVNRDIFIRTLSLLIVFAYVTREGAQFGAVVLAANVVLFNFQDMMAFALDGFANAGEALVGEAMGKQDGLYLQQVLRKTAFFSIVLAGLFTLLYIGVGRSMIGWLTSIANVQQTAYNFMIYMVISPIVSVWSFWLDGIFVGAMRATAMRNCMLISAAVFFVTFASLRSLGNHGLWIAFLSFMATRAISMALWLRHRPLMATP